MTRIFAALGLVIGLAGPGMAQVATGQKDGIRDTIDGQMQAFVARDVERAFSFAAPNIKSMFGTPERFGMMVREGYPMVWSNSNVVFLDLAERQGNLWQRVQLQGPQGAFHYLDYLMVKIDTGWQIAAVVYVPDPGVGA